MIHFNQSTKTFNLVLKTSYYAMQVNREGCLVHLGWGVRAGDLHQTLLISGERGDDDFSRLATFGRQMRRDELITFGDVSYHEVTLKASFAALPAQLQAGEAPHLPIRDARLRYAGHEVVSDAQPGLAPQHGLPALVQSPRETLRVILQDPVQPLRVVLCYRLTPEHDIIERWCELEHTGPAGAPPITIEVCGFATLHFPNGCAELTSVAGAWANEFNIQRERLPVGLRIIEGRSVQTSHAANPFFMLNMPGQAGEETGAVYFGALAYSGAWRITLEQIATLDVRVHAGYNPFDFELELAAGQKHITPAIACGVSDAGRGGASRRLHAFIRERVVPRPARALADRPVLYNSWEATYFDLSAAGQIALARKAAAVGVELFCVDDGWFGARRDDHAGLGDWTVRRDAFPDGLMPLIDEVRRLGMKFGLWVEPEMVNPNSDLYRAHPDWVLHFPGRPRSEARNQLILDFGRPEVVAHIFAALDALLSEYPIDFIKWDMNRNSSEPGSVAGKMIWIKHVEGVYRIMDDLRRKHPGVDIQSCSGGGGRIDLGILARTDQVWTSDNTDALDRIHIQEGYSLAYPARLMESWVTHAVNHLTHRLSPLGLRFDVAMRGALGIGSSLNELSDAELAEYASYIAFYKRIRPVVQNGDLYRLQNLSDHGASVIEYCLSDGSEAVYSLAVREHGAGVHRPPAVLKGLKADVMYGAFDRQGAEVLRASCYELMTLGIADDGRQGAGFSRTLHIRQQLR